MPLVYRATRALLLVALAVPCLQACSDDSTMVTDTATESESDTRYDYDFEYDVIVDYDYDGYEYVTDYDAGPAESCLDYCDVDYDIDYDYDYVTDYDFEIDYDVDYDIDYEIDYDVDTLTITDTDTDSDTDTWTDTDTDTDTTTDTDSWTDTDTDSTDTWSTDTDTDTDGTDTWGTETDTDTDTDTDTGGEEGFPPPGDFGDDVQETDLVGTWTLNWVYDQENQLFVWDPDAGWNSELTITETGDFVWRELDANCMNETIGSGFLWVEGSQIVMHIDVWERELPWDSMPVLGEVFDPPFRVRLSYSLQGPNLSFSAPPAITATQTYDGRSETRQTFEGEFLGGWWYGETELWAIPEGQLAAHLIVRDVFRTYLEPHWPNPDPDNIPYEGGGSASYQRIWWYNDPVLYEDVQYSGANWTCLNGCAQPAGTALIDGGNLHAYGPYAGFSHLMSFQSGRAFKATVEPLCP